MWIECDFYWHERCYEKCLDMAAILTGVVELTVSVSHLALWRAKRKRWPHSGFKALLRPLRAPELLAEFWGFKRILEDEGSKRNFKRLVLRSKNLRSIEDVTHEDRIQRLE